MQRYIMESNIALRGWLNRPYTYLRHEHGNPHDLSKAEFLFLLDCDGSHEANNAVLAESLVKKGLIRASGQGETLSKWQEYRFYPHIYYREIMFEITEKCNYNCRHCFNAESTGTPRAELSVDEISSLSRQAAAQGISGADLTGGEPMRHPRFMEVVRVITDAGLKIRMINTNGAYITDEILEEFTKAGIRPSFRISFDGMGFHEWMRGVKGAQEQTLKAISLCIKKHFPVLIQTNLNKRNLSVMRQTIDEMDAAGVEEMRIIRTTEAPRWVQQAGNDCLSWEEYFDEALALLSYYESKPRSMRLVFWQFVNAEQKTKRFQVMKIQFQSADAAANRLPCQEKLSIGADGQIYPCLQMSGALKEHGVRLADTKKEALSALLSDSPYMRVAAKSGLELKDGNERCRNCPFAIYCAGGCPAISLITHGKYDAQDNSSCVFFRDGYYRKIKEILRDYKDVRPMPDSIDPSYLKQFDYRIDKFLDIDPGDFL